MILFNFLGSKILLRANGMEGQAQLPNFFAVYFALRNTNLGGGESEGEAGIHFSHTPFSARLARAVWRAKRAVSSVQKRFGFRQTNAPEFDFRIFDRPNPRRVAPRHRETLARRARRGSPSAGSKSPAILSICFAQ